MPVELGAVATPGTAIIKQGADGVRIASGSALDVQTLDVARPFPDGVDGRLTVQPGEDALFYIAIAAQAFLGLVDGSDRKSTRLNSSHVAISYAVFCLKKKKREQDRRKKQK